MQETMKQISLTGCVPKLEIASFENELSNYLGVRYSLALNSGTSALHTALRTLHIGKDDEVILPSYTCTALLQAVSYVHAKPIFADINYNPEKMDYNINNNSILNNITDSTKAIILPHMFGSPADVIDIKEICDENEICLIEDATQCIGSKLNNKKIGSFGRISVSSFHETKMLSCIDGGALLTDNNNDFIRAKYLSDYSSEQEDLRISDKTYFYDEERYNYKMTNINASFGLLQLKILDKLIVRRKEIAKIYNDAFQNLSVDMPDITYKPNVYHRYVISLRETNYSIKILKSMLNNGIQGGRCVYPPLHYYVSTRNELVNTEKALKNLVSIPLYPSLTDKEIETIITTVKEVLK